MTESKEPAVSATAPASVAPRHFRDVLGHFPTGVVVITAVGSDGAPIGMAVGSFTSVSLDPPLVAFLPEKKSTTFTSIRDAGRFCVNVLAGGQEKLCRQFATRGVDRFRDVAWQPGAHTGAPILDGAVSWIECEMGEVHESGDHFIVMGRVLDLGVQTPTIPLLFFQGGYGTFAPRSLVVAAQQGLSAPIRMADAARDELESLTAKLGLECRVLALQDDHLVIVATAGHNEGADPVGATLPFFPPFGATIPAWDTRTRESWWANFPGGMSDDARRANLDSLEAVRARGWDFTFETDAQREAAEIVADMAEYGPTPSLERQLAAVGPRVSGLADPSEIDARSAAKVRTISAPAINAEGHVIHLMLYGFDGHGGVATVDRARDALVEASRRLTERFGGDLTAS